jgi:class 3 adenylate cyclase
MASTRRLAAILAADVVGYSRLMGVDEEGTLAALKAIRRDLADPKIKEHRGRIVKTTGDGLLLEFASVVDAVRCAVEVHAKWRSETPMCRQTAASSSAWGSMSVTSSRTDATSTGMGSMSRHASKP